MGSWANSAIKGQRGAAGKMHTSGPATVCGTEPALQEAGPIESLSVRPWRKCAGGVGLTNDTEKGGRSVVRVGWSMASRDVEIPAVTYFVYLVGVGIAGSMCVYVGWKSHFTLLWKRKQAASAFG